MSVSPLPLQVVTRLAAGLIEQHEQSLQGNAPPITTPNCSFKTGLEQLAVLCLREGVAPPGHHKEAVKWLHTPLEEWPAPIGTQLAAEGLYDSLLFLGIPTELAYELTARLGEGDPTVEIQDLAFKEIIHYCRNQQLAEQYVNARRFLVDHPHLSTGTHVIQNDLTWDNEVSKLLSGCYELIPLSCRVPRKDGQEWIARCPRCGWVLEWHRSRYAEIAYCYSDLCSTLVERISQPQHWEPYQREAMRTARGIQQFIVAPEKSLLELKVQLEELGATCHLWPHFDSYDLLVELPSINKRIAIDMKDYSSPAHLANVLQPFQRYPTWDECYYVFPDYRKRGNYLKRFKTDWSRRCKATPSLKSIGIKFATDFIKVVRKKLEETQ